MRRARCTCTPCQFPANGAHGLTHCAECCMGTLVDEFDPACPIAAHRGMAALQFSAPTASVGVS